MPSILKAAAKQFLRRYKVKPHEYGMRAVFLGDSVSTRVILDGLFERDFLLALQRDVFAGMPTGAVALDVGANIGNHACFMAHHFARVVAFEPNPVVFHVLKANTIGRNIEPHNLGLSNRNGQLPFVVKYPNYGLAHVATEGETPDFSIDVQPLDAMVEGVRIDRVDFLKLDVDGHEIEVLEGALGTISKFKPVIAMEAMYKNDPALGQKTIGLLESTGYRFFYEFAPPPGAASTIAALGMASARNPLRYFVPEALRKSVTLRQVPDLRGRNNELCVLSTTPLL